MAAVADGLFASAPALPNRVTRAVLKKVSEGDRWRLELEQQSMLVGLIKTSTDTNRATLPM